MGLSAPAASDALFELSNAVLCKPGPMISLPELSLAAMHRRGHGAPYDDLACGRRASGQLALLAVRLALWQGNRVQFDERTQCASVLSSTDPVA
jgi:hypothetical protein